MSSWPDPSASAPFHGLVVALLAVAVVALSLLVTVLLFWGV